MKRTKLLISLATAGLLTVGIGPSLLPASGQQLSVPTNVPDLTCPDGTLLPRDGRCPATPPPSGGSNTSPGTTPSTPSPSNPARPKPNRPGSRRPRGNAPSPNRPARKPSNRRTRSGNRSAGSKKPQAGPRSPSQRRADGQPTPANPSFSFSTPGPAQIGVPNFFIEKFRIPPFLLPIYQAAGIQYGVPWQVLAAINEIETDYGRNLNVSSAGAMGWMQFIPSSWRMYGVDGNGDGRKDPYNPVDAIFAAARYLKAAGAPKDMRRAIFAYNHADWYVDSVLLRARLIGGMPDSLIGSLTGLTQGHFPVAARSTYADDLADRQALARRSRASGNAAVPVDSSPSRRGINVYSKPGAPVIAVNDGVIKAVGRSARLGNYVVLQDVYGNAYTYSHLGKVAPSYPSPKPKPVSARQVAAALRLPKPDPRPSQPASAGRQRTPQPRAPGRTASRSSRAATITVAKERLFAHPARSASYRAGGQDQLLQTGRPVAGYETFDAYFAQVLGLKRSDVVLKALKPGAQVIAGTVLGRIDKTDPKLAPHLHFEIRPAGKGAPLIDPKPILDGWKLLESTAIYRAAGKNPFFGPDARNPSIGQIMLMSKEQLEQRVLRDPRIQIYDCGRRDIVSGQIDRRPLAVLAYLAASGFSPTVSSLKCGHSFYTKAGGVSEHSSGNAVDIAAINGIPILGHQGAGSITDIVVRRLLLLQGTMKPHQIITLYQYPGTDNTLALSDHADHIHVGFYPQYGTNPKLAQQVNAALKPGQWIKLIDRLSEIDNPVVSVKPSRAAIPDRAE